MSVDNQEEVIVLSDAPLTLTVPFQKLGDKPLTNQSRLALNLEEIEYNPSNVIPYQIYINLPEGATANPESPYYLSNFCAAS
jgi:tyrosinase